MTQPIDKKTIEQWSSKFRNWHYYPELVLSNSPNDGMNFRSVDCPLVFQLENDSSFYMFYTGYNGQGYQTMLSKSDNLIDWQSVGVAMSFGEQGAYDHGGVTFGGALFQSYDLNAPRLLKKFNSKYRVLYGCYPRQGGYELRPGAQGAAASEDGIHWARISPDKPILSVNGAEEWEKDCIYQPWLVEHEGTFYNFYNAANEGTEQTGVCFSQDLLNWTRTPENPVVVNGKTGSYDEHFCSDGKVFFDKDHWVMFYFGVGRGGAHIMTAYSYDLLHWTKDEEPLYKAGGHPLGLDAKYAHKISHIYNPKNDTFYMFYNAVSATDTRGIALLTSKPL